MEKKEGEEKKKTEKKDGKETERRERRGKGKA